MPTKLSALQFKRSQEAPFVFQGVVCEVARTISEAFEARRIEAGGHCGSGALK